MDFFNWQWRLRRMQRVSLWNRKFGWMMDDGIEWRLKGKTKQRTEKFEGSKFRFRRRIVLNLDGIHRYQAVLSLSKTEFHPNPSSIYIGGYHRLCTYNANHCHSYRGCLKNLTIDQQSVDLINDEINSNRLLKPCHDLYWIKMYIRSLFTNYIRRNWRLD